MQLLLLNSPHRARFEARQVRFVGATGLHQMRATNFAKFVRVQFVRKPIFRSERRLGSSLFGDGVMDHQARAGKKGRRWSRLATVRRKVRSGRWFSVGLERLESRVVLSNTVTWTGTGNGNWSDPADWMNSVAPMAGDNLIFPSGPSGSALKSSNDFPSGTSFGSLTVQASGYVIGGNAVALSGSLDAAQTTGSSEVDLPIDLGASTLTVMVGTAGVTLVLDGVMSGQGGVAKQGAGELDLKAANTYSGSTTISGGLVRVDGTVSGAVAAGSATTLGGIGTVGSITTTQATVSPGDGGPGLLTDTGSLTFGSGSNYNVTLSGTTAGSQYSQLQVAGPISLSGATLNVTLGSGFTPTGGSQFTIIHNTGSSPISGTFTNLPQGAKVTVGGHTFTISYTGGAGNDVVLSTVIQTMTTVSFQPAAPVFGESVALSATVTPATTGFGTPTGSVDFKNGSTNLGMAKVGSTGVATLDTSSLPVALNSITAVYSGDTAFAGSTSTAMTVTVVQASTTTTLTSSLNPSAAGEPVTLTATVAAVSPGAGTPTGSVEFFSGSTDVGAGTLTNGIATLRTSGLPVGTDALKANYSSDTNFKASSGTASQKVNSGTVTVTVTVSNPNPFGGQAVTLTAVVSITSGAGTPTGIVTFFDSDGTNLGSSALSNNTATLSVSTLPVGKQSITAVYSGDTNFQTATSPATSIVVGSPAELFINQVYMVVIGAAAEPSGNFWIAQLNGGYPRGLIVQQIVGSPQASVQAVEVAFQTFLGRAATAMEIRTQLAKRHASAITLGSSVLGSNEFFQTKGGGTNAGFLTALGEAVLGTELSSAPRAHYGRELKNGVSRQDVAQQLLMSPSGVAAQINTLYEDILGRPADRKGLAAFAAPIRQGRISRVIDALLSSQEFFVKTVNV
jgi:autotransporter-associated beta strand protein